MYAFALYYLVLYGVPLAAAGFVFIAGASRPRPAARHVVVWFAFTALLAYAAVKIRLTPAAGTSYADFLRLMACTAGVGSLLGLTRALRLRRRSARPPQSALNGSR